MCAQDRADSCSGSHQKQLSLCGNICHIHTVPVTEATAEPVPLGSENLTSHLHAQVLGDWECYLSPFYPQGGPPFKSCLEEDMR